MSPHSPLQHISCISFGEFMRLSLYGGAKESIYTSTHSHLDSKNNHLRDYLKPSLPGYYASTSRVGKEGDFYTSVSASRFFGGAMAMYILKLLDSGKLNTPLRIVEIGADKGYLLGDVAQFLDALSEGLLSSVEFATLEPLESLAQAQREYFAKLRLSQKARFCVYEDLASLCKSTWQSVIIISNEIFDSVPCEIVRVSESSTEATSSQMLYITLENESMMPFWGEVSDEIVAWQHTQGIAVNQSMIVPRWEGLLGDIEAITKAHKSYAYFLSFDYGGFGLEQPLSYNPRFYHAHQVVSMREILAHKVGLEGFYKKADITYDVDFNLLEALLIGRGFRRVYAKSQARVLVEEMGLLELLEMYETHKGYGSYLSQIQKVKTLLHTMGSRFMGVCYEFVP